MKLLIPKPSLSEVLQYLKIQAQESINQIPLFFPPYIDTPESFFLHCKASTKYKSDMKGIEYIQTVKTLFNKNKGRGDCDCFTVLALAGLTYYNLADSLYICLVGKSKSAPSHIYVSGEFKNKPFIFDLTNQFFDFERCKNYKYKQQIKINL